MPVQNAQKIKPSTPSIAGRQKWRAGQYERQTEWRCKLSESAKRIRPPEPCSGGGACVCGQIGYIAGTIPLVVASIGRHGRLPCLPRSMLSDQVLIGTLSPWLLLTYSKVGNDCQICKRINHAFRLIIPAHGSLLGREDDRRLQDQSGAEAHPHRAAAVTAGGLTISLTFPLCPAMSPGREPVPRGATAPRAASTPQHRSPRSTGRDPRRSPSERRPAGTPWPRSTRARPGRYRRFR
jgi:hypothetical protein